MDNVKLVTYNCRGLPNNDSKIKCKPCIKNIFDNPSVTFACFQETFHTKQDLNHINNLNADFHGVGTATVDETSSLMQGHAPGGVAIFWRTKFDNIVKPLTFELDWIVGIELCINDKKCVILNVYMPCDTDEHEEQYLNNLGSIICILNDLDCTCVFIFGDWNSNINGSNFGDLMKQFIQDSDLKLSSHLLLPSDTFTFLSEVWNTTSWLDHCVSTADAHEAINQITVDYNGAVSDHFPIFIEFSIDDIPAVTNCNNDYSPKFDWKKINLAQISEYANITDKLLNEVKVPNHAVVCRDANCKDPSHVQDIEKLYNDIVECLKDAGLSISPPPNIKCKYKVRPGWNDYVSEFYDYARECLNIWRDAGKPRHGNIFNLMSRSRARFKYALRAMKRKEDQIRGDKFAEVFLNSSPEHFWKEIKKINCAKSSLPTSLEGVSGNEEIVKLWKKHYLDLFNCIKDSSSKTLMCNDINFCESMIVTYEEILKSINKLQPNKSCGLDGIYAEHMKHASRRLCTLLALCFSSCFVHGFLPGNLMSVILVPIIKDKAGKINSKDNYRPIALASIISKVLEMIILDRISDFLLTNENQFGFKKRLGTDSCIYVLKEVVDRYRCLNGTVFMCFLDASKAFDRVNHLKLFMKLKKRGVPLFIVRILSYWYSNQTMCVRWGGTISDKFCVSNGVRQGSVLSPFLFNVYMDGLSCSLNTYPTGCYIGDSLVNHLMYADDLVLICPSATGLCSLLQLCENFGIVNDVKFNSTKSIILICRSKSMKNVDFGQFTINNDIIPNKLITKYLGHYICSDLKDDRDIMRQCQYLYGQGNMLSRKFHMCSDDVKIKLFRTYCSSMYTSQLWWNYTKRAIKKLIVAYNNAFRMLMKLPRDCSASGMFANNRVPSGQAILRNLCFKFLGRTERSVNGLVKAIIDSDMRWCSRMRIHWYSMLYTCFDPG